MLGVDTHETINLTEFRSVNTQKKTLFLGINTNLSLICLTDVSFLLVKKAGKCRNFLRINV